MRVILASHSIQRKALLASFGFAFETLPADIDELAIDDADHAVRAAKVARAKAEKITQLQPDAVVIAADTFLLLDGKRIEKPETKIAAKAMLEQMSGQEMTVYTGWAFIDAVHQVEVSQTAVAGITFRRLHTSEIERYVENFPVTSWAGGFTLSHMEGAALVADLRGSLTAVLGLPLEDLIPHLVSSRVLV